LNTEVIREQLVELRSDLDAGKLDPAAYRAARHDLERELLTDVDGESEDDIRSERSGRWAVGLFALTIPSLAVLLYLLLGSAPLLDQQGSPPPSAESDAPEQTGHPLEQMVAKLASRLEQDPQNPDGWVLLGRSYATLSRYREAANAYGQAVRLAGDRPQLLVDYADVLTMSTGGRFTPEAGSLLQRALDNQPDNLKGLWLMGHYKYQQQDYQGAISDWRQAAAQLPPDGEDSAIIRQQIANAEDKITEAGGTVAPEPVNVTDKSGAAPSAKPTKSVTVSVRLDDALSDRASPQDTVFVFARAANGPRMPLAIVRKQVADLPLTVTLDDSQAMSPAMVLSNFEQVTIGARVSKSGNAMPQSGDLQGAVTPVNVEEGAEVAVTIDSVNP
jgi:cytochrome c-type biogenesis protein CcmH